MTGGESNNVHFGFESQFKSPVTANKVFGENVNIRSVDLKNNIRRLFRLGSRSAVDLVAGRFEGAISIEFDISDPWFMKGVLGDLQTSAPAGGPYYHCFIEADKPPSLTIENAISGVVRKYLGVILGDCRIGSAVGDEPAKCTLTGIYADETISSGAVATQTAPVDGVYPFSYGSIQYPTGTTVADTESLEMTITNNAALKWALGDRKASRYDMRQRTYDVTTTNYFDDATTYLRRAYGTSGTTMFYSTPATKMISGEAGITISLDNGAISSQIRKWDFVFTNSVIDRHSLGTQSVEQEQMETVDIIPESLRIVVTNNTSAMP